MPNQPASWGYLLVYFDAYCIVMTVEHVNIQGWTHNIISASQISCRFPITLSLIIRLPVHVVSDGLTGLITFTALNRAFVENMIIFDNVVSRQFEPELAWE